jgi:antitoxin CcdA
MKSALQAPKRAVNLSLDGALVDRARALTGNLSAKVETLLTAFVESREAENEVEAARLRDAARSWNEFDERHGSFADEFSTL